jgi:hypothetical protein
MKKYVCTLLALVTLSNCDDNEQQSTGNPTLELVELTENVRFGDSLAFQVNAYDDPVTLSTLKAQLLFGDEVVADATLRTKSNGFYTGKLFIPFLPNVPDGTATLELVLTNVSMNSVKQAVSVPIQRPDYPYLILVTADGQNYPMVKVEQYQYQATQFFPNTEVNAVIKTPVTNQQQNQITFGWSNGNVAHDATEPIPFVSPSNGKFTISFNTLTYQAAPFFELSVNDQQMNMISKNIFQIDLQLHSQQEIIVKGVANINDWWTDQDFIQKTADHNKFVFKPIDGNYRIIADANLNFLQFQPLNNANPATLQPDGTGTVWIIGEGIGKPNLDNQVGWNTDKALPMAPIGNKKYQITLTAGTTVNADNINFKFFHQPGWGGEFTSATLASNSNIIFVGDGNTTDYLGGNRDDGNLGLTQPLEHGATYILTLDLSNGVDNAVLDVGKQ